MPDVPVGSAIRLLIFDLDGTLVDTAGEIADSVNDVLRAVGLDPLPEARIRNWIGHGAARTVRCAYAERSGVHDSAELDKSLPDLMTHFAAAHERHCGTRSHLYPGVADTLDILRKNHQPMALATNKEARFTESVLKQHGLSACFDPRVSGDTLPTRKPDPAPVLHCLDHHRVDRHHAILVGDSEVDAQTARAAGIRFWAVPYGYNGGRPIAASAPDRLLPDFSAVLDGLSFPKSRRA